MVSKEYSEALVEVLEILNMLEDEDLKKIPTEIIDFYENYKSLTYNPHIEFNGDISSLNLKDKTKEILAGLYIDYLCDSEEEKQDYMQKLKKQEAAYEKHLMESYNPDKLFQSSQIPENNSEKSITVIEKENIVKKILNKKKRLFKK